MNKKRIQLTLVVIMVTMGIGSFALIFLGNYVFGFIIGGLFMFLANSISQWFSDKSNVYVYRNTYENNKDRWNKY
jgi:predicted PurR-regulated permease PerM